MEKLFLVLDTETIGGVRGGQEVVDFGFVVAGVNTKNYQVDQKMAYNGLVTENLYPLLDGKISQEDSTFWTETRRCFYHVHQFQAGVKVKPANYHRAVLLNTISKYPGITICAYNLPFDTQAVKNTLNINLSEYEHSCIWSLAVQTLGQQKTFRRLLTAKEMYSASGKFFSSNAETMYRYINLNWEHVEAHTALSDAQEELEILVKCLRQKKKTIPNVRNPFQKVKIA